MRRSRLHDPSSPRVALRAGRFALACVALAACRGEPLSLGDGNGGSTAPEDAGPRPMPEDAGPRPMPEDAGPSPVPEFGEPRPIPELAGSDAPDDDPSLSADRLLLCFNSKRDGGAGKEDIWCTSRAQSTAPWGAPAPLAELNTDTRETGIALAADGLKLWFSSDRDGGAGGLDVYTSERASREAPWSAAVRVPELSTEADDLVSSIDDTSRTLLLARRQNDDDDYDVLWAQRTGPAQPWQAPTPIQEINSDDEESDAFLVGAGLELIFTRDGDLMLARRKSPTAPFDAGSELSSLNSDDDERDAWSDAALRYVVFSSDRGGEHRLYEAWR